MLSADHARGWARRVAAQVMRLDTNRTARPYCEQPNLHAICMEVWEHHIQQHAERGRGSVPPGWRGWPHKD